MELNEFVSIICTILSALSAGTSFYFYKKTINIYKTNINNKKVYQNISQQSDNGGKNVVGDNNTF